MGAGEVDDRAGRPARRPQWEIILGVRVRCAVALPNYTVQPMDQDPFVEIESKAVDGPDSRGGFIGVRQMNLALAASLTPDQRRIVVVIPSADRST